MKLFSAALTRRRLAFIVTLVATVFAGMLQAQQPTALSRPVLRVDAVVGTVWAYLGEARKPLVKGDVISAGMRVVTEGDGRVNLLLSRHGRIDVGAYSELRVITLPFSSYATSLTTELQLVRGPMRVVWKHPQLSTTWPIYVGLVDMRASLSTGEYFFDRTRNASEACVAAGQIGLSHVDSPRNETLRPIACYNLANRPAARSPKRSVDWVRRRHEVRALSPEMLAATAPRAHLPPVTQGREGFEEEYRRLFMSDPVNRDAPPAPRTQPTVTAQPAPAPAQTQPSAATQVAQAPQASQAPPSVSAPADAPTADGAILPADGEWALTLGSYRREQPAVDLSKRLERGGYPAIVVPVIVRDQQWYRVQVVGYTSVADANRASADIAARLGRKGGWVSRR